MKNHITPKKLLVVINADNQTQTLDDSQLAYDRGADGIFLTNSRIHYGLLGHIYQKVRQLHPKLWIGLNFADQPPICAINRAKCLEPEGLWLNNIRYDESQTDPVETVKRIYEHKTQVMPKSLLFGSVASSYQNRTRDFARTITSCSEFVDVVTSNDLETGEEAKPEDISQIKKAIGAKPLALVSAVTPNNYHQFLDADYFIIDAGGSNGRSLNGEIIGLLKSRLLRV